MFTACLTNGNKNLMNFMITMKQEIEELKASGISKYKKVTYIPQIKVVLIEAGRIITERIIAAVLEKTHLIMIKRSQGSSKK